MFPWTRLYLGTDDGLRVLEGEDLTIGTSALAGQTVRDIAVHPANPDTAWVGCALGGSGLHRTLDGGTTTDVVGFDDRWVWGVDWLADDRLYVGTEPPRLFRSEDGKTFTALDGIQEVAGRDSWTFLYEPFKAGHVHGLTAHRARPRRLFAAIEIGGVIHSEDGGETWQAHLQGADVHRLLIAPENPDHVFAATETGIYESEDAGTSWHPIEATEGLYVKLLRAGPGGTVYAPTASDMGDTDVQLFVWNDNWEQRGSITGTSVVAFATVDGTLLLQQAGEHGRLVYSEDDGRTWTPVGPSLPRVRCIRPISL